MLTHILFQDGFKRGVEYDIPIEYLDASIDILFTEYTKKYIHKEIYNTYTAGAIENANMVVSGRERILSSPLGKRKKRTITETEKRNKEHHRSQVVLFSNLIGRNIHRIMYVYCSYCS